MRECMLALSGTIDYFDKDGVEVRAPQIIPPLTKSITADKLSDFELEWTLYDTLLFLITKNTENVLPQQLSMQDSLNDLLVAVDPGIGRTEVKLDDEALAVRVNGEPIKYSELKTTRATDPQYIKEGGKPNLRYNTLRFNIVYHQGGGLDYALLR